jgi:hypothetical protein
LKTDSIGNKKRTQNAMFVKAKDGKNRSVIYWNEDGSTVIYRGGNRTWRNQNPGNIGGGAWSNRHGAIGKAGGFAVFPDYETGRAAIFSRLTSPDFIEQTIWDAIPHYAPASENDVKWYRNLVHQVTDLDLKRKIKDLNKDELESLVNAIERAEGKFKPGKVNKISAKKRISAVRKNQKGTIVGYFVNGLGWLAKNRAIQLARLGKIDAVVAHSRSGTVYLKARPDKTVGNNLGSLG